MSADILKSGTIGEVHSEKLTGLITEEESIRLSSVSTFSRIVNGTVSPP